ncbi:MEKHLA domain-containing protein [Halomicronema sp. CCY15110]|uniref:MEKHLA domain-containing protein n=1 Tax=Halomicronema sp. CCY15110 TaxID=2767773 RepID=UPI0019502818|nr:MEKHLA domain-containing protein [Halomicronema sp. CCY15110]
MHRSPDQQSQAQLWSRQLAHSYQHWRHQPLVTVTELQTLAQALFEAPVAIVSHGTQADPIFNYANRCALNLWELDWDTFTQMPSRLSAEPMHRDERAQMLAQLQTHGFVDNYQGIRISSQGQRFYIQQAVIWNVIDDTGTRLGQAATFANWQFL